MKQNRYIYFLLLVLVILGWSCERDEISGFEADPGISFVKDSIGYSFIQNNSDEYTLEVPVRIIGDSTNYDRSFNVDILQDSLTTADPSLYEIMEGMIPAGKFTGNLLVRLKKAPVLDSTAVSLHLQLTSSADFSPGTVETMKTKLTWTNKIIVPSWTFFRYFFCRYPSTRAYRIFIETTGMTTFTLQDYLSVGPTGAKALGTAFGDYIRDYNEAHPDAPLVHDDGPNAGEPIVPIY